MQIIEETLERCELLASKVIADKITELANIQEKVVFGIPGTRDLENVFKHLLKEAIPWKKVHIFMTDERCVSLNSLESNYKKAYDLFIKELIDSHKLPKENAHPFIYDPENAPSSIKKYDQAFGELGRKFDIILASSGSDGHVAALFPKHNSVITENSTFFLMNNAPKLPPKRMTAPRKLLQSAKVGVIVFFGKEKQAAFELFTNPASQIVNCPARIFSTLPESFVFKSTN